MIYFDNAATTKPIKIKQFDSFVSIFFGNPSSRHKLGKASKEIIDESRAFIANSLNCKINDIYFTSGGTQANNIVFNTAYNIFLETGKNEIITTKIEHESILNTLKFYEKKGIKVIYLNSDKNGKININDLKNAINDKTLLISIQYINNEIGTIQDIENIGKLAKQKKILFHTDAVQAIGHIKIDLNELNIDFLSSSGHKFNSIKGIGFLYSKIKPTTFIYGGGQEQNIISGTENLVGIYYLHKALKFNLDNLEKNQSKIKRMVAYIEKQLAKNKNIKLNIQLSDYHSIINFTIKGIKNESIISLLSEKEIYCSSASACLGNSTNFSYVLKAIGKTKNEIESSIRVSLSWQNTFKECRIFITELNKIIDKLESLI